MKDEKTNKYTVENTKVLEEWLHRIEQKMAAEQLTEAELDRLYKVLFILNL